MNGLTVETLEQVIVAMREHIKEHPRAKPTQIIVVQALPSMTIEETAEVGRRLLQKVAA